MISLLSIVSLAGSLALSTASPALPPASLEIDLDGDGAVEQVSVVAGRRKARIEVRQTGAGKTIARADVPVPKEKGDGIPQIALSAGSLGSAGSLVEVAAVSGNRECRSVWRLRDRALLQVPISSREWTDCAAKGEWSYGWDRPSDDAPAGYRRERTVETGLGPHRKVEVLRYAGFRLEPDASRWVSEVRGIAIPSWYAATLYRRSALDGLYARFDLSELKRGPRLRIVTDPDRGVFSVSIQTAAGERTLPVTKLERGAEANEVLLTLGSSNPLVIARIGLAGKTGVPGEVTLRGAGPEADALYTPATLFANEVLRVFATAEDALISTSLVGSWSGPNGEPLQMTLASSDPAVVAIGKAQFGVEIGRAPDGIDALLIPKAGGPPAAGLILRGPNSLERVPVRCEGASTPFQCRPDGPAEVFRRIGGRINAR